MSDPYIVDNLRGNAFDAKVANRRTTWVGCTVMEVYTETYSCAVQADDKSYHVVAWPSAYRDPNKLAGDVQVPKPGQRMALHHAMGELYLAHQLPTASPLAPVGEHKVFYGVQHNPTMGPPGTINYRGSLPSDVNPGDWVRVGTEGNMVGVLEGGVALLKATEVAKVVAHSVGDLLQLVGRNMDINSDFGQLSFKNDGGHVTMKLRGGAHQKTESSTDEEKFTIRADLGADGDLVDFQISDPKGVPLTKIHWWPDGSVENVIGGELSQDVSGTASLTAASVSQMVSGDVSHTIGGSVDESVANSVTRGAGGNIAMTAGNDASLYAVRDMTLTAGAKLSVTASGNALAKPGDTALSTVVTNGSYVIDVGHPLADPGVAQSGFSVTTHTGDINLEAGPPGMGSISLSSTHVDLSYAPDDAAVLYNALKTYLDALNKKIDTHVHPVGPNTPASVPIPNPATEALLPPLLTAARSKFVKLG